MSDWILVPSLVALREEFNAVSPGRDKGADGSIGDSNHTSSSDHTPDEDSTVLRDKDSDHKNEVHALDVDSSGPWPGGASWFDSAVLRIVNRHRNGEDNRLHYVIWNGKIAGESSEWEWRIYKGKDPHDNHAHFSNKYTDAAESDTSNWGVNNMPLNDADLAKIHDVAQDAVADFFALAYRSATGTDSSKEARFNRQILQGVIGGPIDTNALTEQIVNRLPIGNGDVDPAVVKAAVEAGVKEVLTRGTNAV